MTRRIAAAVIVVLVGWGAAHVLWQSADKWRTAMTTSAERAR